MYRYTFLFLALLIMVSCSFLPGCSDNQWDNIQYPHWDMPWGRHITNFQVNDGQLFAVLVSTKHAADAVPPVVLVGDLTTPEHVALPTPADNARIAITDNAEVIYLATGLTQSTEPYTEITRLYRSRDGGHHWQPLNWPAKKPITALHFSDERHGYALGYGPSLWRTTDAGHTWQKVPLPKTIMQPGIQLNPAIFSASHMDDTGRLWLAIHCFSLGPGGKASLFVLDANASKPQLRLTLDGQDIYDIAVNRVGSMYLLASYRKHGSTSVWHVQKDNLTRLALPDKTGWFAVAVTPTQHLLALRRRHPVGSVIVTALVRDNDDDGWKKTVRYHHQSSGGKAMVDYDAKQGRLYILSTRASVDSNSEKMREQVTTLRTRDTP